MSLFLHQIFYGDNKFDINEESVAALEKWAVISVGGGASTPIDRFFGIAPLTLDIPESTVKSGGTSPVAPRPSRSASFTKPKDDSPTIQTPSVFWCMFVAHYGYAEYLRVGTRTKNRELEEKQTIMAAIAKQPKPLREGNMKLTHDSVQEILSTLMTSSNSDFLELVAYSHYYKKTVYVVFEHAYLVFIPASSAGEDTIVLTKHADKYVKSGSGGRYSLDATPTPETLDQIRHSKVALDHYAKPFRGVSSYKLDELEAFARKVGVLADPSKKYKKAELYAAIVDKCCEGLR